MLQATFVTRVEELETILDRASLEDFVISNDGRAINDVARDVLSRAGWLVR